MTYILDQKFDEEEICNLFWDQIPIKVQDDEDEEAKLKVGLID